MGSFEVLKLGEGRSAIRILLPEYGAGRTEVAVCRFMCYFYSVLFLFWINRSCSNMVGRLSIPIAHPIHQVTIKLAKSHLALHGRVIDDINDKDGLLHLSCQNRRLTTHSSRLRTACFCRACTKKKKRREAIHKRNRWYLLFIVWHRTMTQVSYVEHEDAPKLIWHSR